MSPDATAFAHIVDYGGYPRAVQRFPRGGTGSQIWVVTTNPDDRDARQIDYWPVDAPDGTAELIGWDGTHGAAPSTPCRQ
jgi:hypothetical protein